MRTQRQRFSRTLLETLESRTLLSATLPGDPVDTDPSSIPPPPIQVPQNTDHVMTLSGTPEIIARSADGMDIKLGTMTDTRLGTGPADYRVWAMLTSSDANFSPFATGEAVANGQGGFDLVAHFQFSGNVPTSVTVHFGVYWAGLLGQAEWPAELALGGHADLTLADATAPVVAANDVAKPAAAGGFIAEFHQLFGADFAAWDAARDGAGETLAGIHDFLASHPGSTEMMIQMITIDGLDSPLSVKRMVIKHVVMPTVY